MPATDPKTIGVRHYPLLNAYVSKLTTYYQYNFLYVQEASSNLYELK